MVAELATLMQLGSYAGVVGDGLKFVSDVSVYGKTPRNIVSFPTASSLVDTQERMTDAMEALRNHDNPWEVGKQLVLDVVTHNIQGLRMVANRTINTDKLDRADKFRDLRTYEMMEGKPAAPESKVNPYLDIESKQFKRTEDIQEAASMMDRLIKSAITKSGGDVQELMKQFEKIKKNNYRTMPSPKEDVVEFAKYYNYLASTQGEQAAQEILTDYFKQNTVNKIKASMIP
jgi:hypothetical protein